LSLRAGPLQPTSAKDKAKFEVSGKGPSWSRNPAIN
jgi:hypothetical protein